MLTLHLGMVLLGLLTTCCGMDIENNSTDPNFVEESPDLNENIESGIVFKDRGKVLITGDSWTIAKEFNITEVVSLVEEAKSLFPDIKRKLELEKHGGQETWDLEFFHDAIIGEIDLVGPIIHKIEDKIKIFQNMLPRKDTDVSETPVRKKRLVGALVARFLVGAATALGSEVVKWLFAWNDDRELRHLNENYERMREYQRLMANVVDEQGKAISDLNERVDENSDKIKKIQSTLDKHFTIISDLEQETHENRQSIKLIASALAIAINQWEKSHKELTHKLNFVVNITSTMRMMEARLLNIDTYLTGLLEALDTTSTGRLSPNLISPSQLVQILRNISRNLPEGVYPLTLVEEDAVYQYYTYASVQALATPSAIRVFVKLPLKSPNRDFHLLEPYSLPFYHKESGLYLEISKPSEYILVSRDLQKVAEIPGKILNECNKKGDFYLCPASFPLYEGSKCSLSLIQEDRKEIIKTCKRRVVKRDFESVWIRTDGGWVYSVSHPLRLMRIREDTHSEIVRINGTGVLKDIPHTYTYSSDGTVLFPNDNLGGNAMNLSVEDVYVPIVPNLLLLNEDFTIQDKGLMENVRNLSEKNSNEEKVEVEHLISDFKTSSPTSDNEDLSNHVTIPFLIVAIIVNYIILGFMCWDKTKKNVLTLKKHSEELEEIHS